MCSSIQEKIKTFTDLVVQIENNLIAFEERNFDMWQDNVCVCAALDVIFPSLSSQSLLPIPIWQPGPLNTFVSVLCCLSLLLFLF